jgi:acetyl-CoA synthetase
LAVECNPDKPIGVMEGYSDSWKTNEVMQGGVYRTGDRVRRENGLLFFVGRDDDVFKCNGYRISPFELESILLEHPAVLEAAVVPKPDAIKGNVPKAFIVLRGKYDHTIINDIDSFQKKKIAPSHRILAIEICDTLPKTSSGKIIRAELRAREKAIYEQNENNANKTYTR